MDLKIDKIAQSYRYKPSKKLVPSKIISDQSNLGWYERDCHFSQVTLNCPKEMGHYEAANSESIYH